MVAEIGGNKGTIKWCIPTSGVHRPVSWCREQAKRVGISIPLPSRVETCRDWKFEREDKRLILRWLWGVGLFFHQPRRRWYDDVTMLWCYPLFLSSCCQIPMRGTTYKKLWEPGTGMRLRIKPWSNSSQHSSFDGISIHQPESAKMSISFRLNSLSRKGFYLIKKAESSQRINTLTLVNPWWSLADLQRFEYVPVVIAYVDERMSVVNIAWALIPPSIRPPSVYALS